MSVLTPPAAFYGAAERVLERFAATLRKRMPALQVSVQHGGSDVFPRWVVARFTNSDKPDKIIDVSLEIKAAADQWSVHVDVAREDGFVLADMPDQSLSSVGPQSFASAIEAFLDCEAERIQDELR